MQIACKSMHPVHARLFTKQAGQEKGLGRADKRRKKAAVMAAASGGINVTGTKSRSVRASDVRAPAAEQVPVPFQAAVVQ